MRIITISREFGSGGREPVKCVAYHLTVNTSEWNIKDLAEATAEFSDSFLRIIK